MTAAQVVLRPATKADLPALALLQEAAYAPMTARLGRRPMPVGADFAALLDAMDIRVAGEGEALDAALILDWKADHLVIWSIAVSPVLKGRRIGSALLDAAEAAAAGRGLALVRLWTNALFTENLAWYQRRGYGIDRVEELPDRRVVHLSRQLTREH
ncbi:GNAT family N-acetyltransferase [Labrys wisconsinensis]|uniref:Ribosomal protein S18 acetylase RimI-like enzyme n=1 Tax=Labrys wisconsinensis TaxID=425677 RepID=A0ABU0JA18_9HYPH|nr:GNAT family N-acetyltransferase [Labrys wisconsinensis]MDQ0471111.1 ribosomal protein S18 acetylase RimI-like enzyme [Labrys wisconsinensis]